MSRSSLTRTWELNYSVCSGLAYHNIMYKCIDHYWDFVGDYTIIRYKIYEPAVIPF